MPMIARPTTRRCPTCGCLPIEWLSASEVAQVLHVKVRTVQRLVSTGEIQAVAFGGVWRIRHAVLHDYLAARGSMVVDAAKKIKRK